MSDDLRTELLAATLRHVPFDGWSEPALKRGAAEIDVPFATARALFPGGGIELLELHSAMTDEKMAQELSEAGLPSMRVRERISYAVRCRLELAGNEREAVRRAVTVLALPRNIATGTRLLFNTVDAMWRAAGDASADWNFYSKRALLAGVYSSSVLYWLQDESEGYEETWAFVDRRIADVMKVPQITGRLGHVLKPFKHTPRPQAPRL